MLEGELQARSAVQSSRRGALAGTCFLAVFRSSEERQALEAAALPVRALQANTDLLCEGGANDQLYVLSESWAYCYKTTRDGKRLCRRDERTLAGASSRQIHVR